MYVNSLFQGHLSRNRNSLTRSFRNLSATEERRNSYQVKINYLILFLKYSSAIDFIKNYKYSGYTQIHTMLFISDDS